MTGGLPGGDFLIKVVVDQEHGVDTYTRALGDMRRRMREVELRLSSLRAAGLRLRGNSTQLQRASAREVDRVFRARSRTRRAMHEVAQGTQRDVVKRLEASYVRPSVSTGALAALTASERNVEVHDLFFGVGDVRMLERDKRVEYAMAIEAGTDAHVGRILYGLWRGGVNIRNWSTPAAAAARTARGALMVGPFGDVTAGVIRRPITKHRSYRKTVQHYRPHRKMADQIRHIYDIGPRR